MGNWRNKTSLQKDKMLLALFSLRGLGTTGYFFSQAGLSLENGVRMAIALTLDVFFTVAAKSIAAIPEKIRIPGVGDWFNKNTELKSFLFNYSVGLGLNLGFMGLGGWVQGFDPYSFEIVLKMAGLQVTDAFMSSVGQRGIRTLVEKGYANGRKEQGFFALLNLLGQVQVNAVWSQNFLVYGVMLGLRSVIQGLTFMASRMLPAKTPNLFVVHANLSKLGQNRNQETVVRGAPELNSLFYMEGITVPEKPIDPERIAEIVREATPGTTGINSLLERFGEFVHIQKWTSNSAEGQGAPSSSHRASKASHDPILCRAIGF